jgi:hypothetical protein
MGLSMKTRSCSIVSRGRFAFGFEVGERIATFIDEMAQPGLRSLAEG